jgi:hypothetical protein
VSKNKKFYDIFRLRFFLHRCNPLNMSRNVGTKGLRTVFNTVSSLNYPGSHAIHTKLFGHKNRSHVNARIGLVGNDKLHYMLMLIADHPLLHVTLDSPRHQNVHPRRYGLKTVRHLTVDTEYRVTDSKLRILRQNIRSFLLCKPRTSLHDCHHFYVILS